MLIAAADWLGLGIVDWIVLGCYFAIVFVIGIVSISKVKDVSDFFMGGRRFGKIFMMFFAFGAGTSSEQAISVVAGTWRVGLAGIWWQFLWLWATPFYWIIAPVMRRMRALTTADFFESRFHTSTATLYSIYGIIMSIAFIAAGLYGSGKMVDALTGGELSVIAERWDYQVPVYKYVEDNKEEKTGHYQWDKRQVKGYEYAILAMTVMFVTYGMAGGLGAAIVTDLIQGILTITFSFLLLPFVFKQIGGFGHLHDFGEPKKGMFDLIASSEVAEQLGREPITILYVIVLSIVALAGIVVQPHIMGVCGAGKTEYEGRFGFTVGNFLKRFCTIAWTFTGLACIIWYMGDDSPLKHSTDPNDVKIYESIRIKNSDEYNALSVDKQKEIDAIDSDFADGLFGHAAYKILPTIAPGLVGLLLASLLAAVMSTSDALMIVAAGLFTENIYKRFFKRKASPRHYLWVGRFAGLGVVLLAIVLQATFTDVIHALKIIIKTPAAIGISFWFGICWRRWNTWAVWVSTFSAVGAWALVAFKFEWLYGLGVFGLRLPETMFALNTAGEVVKIHDVWQNVIYISAGVISGGVVSLITPRMSKEKLDHFFDLIHTPIRPGEHVEVPCTLPENPLPKVDKFNFHPDIEIAKPSFVGMTGFILAWACVGLIIWLTRYLSHAL